MAGASDSAQELLVQLYNAGTPFLDEYPWEFESDRWKELLLCTLVAGLRIESATAVAALDNLDRLHLVSIDDLSPLSDAQRELMVAVLARQGLTVGDAGKAVETMSRVATAVRQRFDGYLQRFLRKHGETMANDLGKSLSSTLDMRERDGHKIAVLWLQRVANIPLLLPDDPHIGEFCRAHRLTPQVLLETADRLGLNVSVLDDLLALEAIAARQEDEVSGKARIRKASRSKPTKDHGKKN